MGMIYGLYFLLNCLLTLGKVAHFRNPKMRNFFNAVLGSLETKPFLSLGVSGPFM